MKKKKTLCIGTVQITRLLPTVILVVIDFHISWWSSLFNMGYGLALGGGSVVYSIGDCSSA